MGGSCSLQRQRALWQRQQQEEMNRNSTANPGMSSPKSTGRKLRHSVEFEVPDGSICSLYPIDDNYVTIEDGYRSPKLLVNLCIDQICRSLPDLEGELPPGLPQDIVNAILKSLVSHAALNATTLKALRRCELGQLPLAGCRGVSDEWLVPLCQMPSDAKSMSTSPFTLPDQMSVDFQQFERTNECNQNCFENRKTGETVDENISCRNQSEESSSCSTSSFQTAMSNLHQSPNQATPVAKHSMYGTPISLHKEQVSDPMEDDVFPLESCGIEHSIISQLTLLDLRGSQRLTDRGLLQLSNLNCLEVAKLDNCHSLNGRGLLAFSCSNQLHTLSLANCRRLTDEAIINISHLTSITMLSLDGCRCLTDRSLESISNLFRLRKLDLSSCDMITDGGLKHLSSLELIDELSLGWCRLITDKGLDDLTSQPGRKDKLLTLRLARCNITDRGVVSLSKLTALEELDLNGCSKLGSHALGETLSALKNLMTLDVSYCPNILRVSWQGKIPSLKSIELCYSAVRDIHLSRLTFLPALEELNLDSCPVGDWAIAHLADNNVVPNLTSLDLADTDLSDLGMVHLPKFQKLTKLSLFYCNISNAGLRFLSTMTSLEVLNLDSRDIGDEGLYHLRNLSRLKSLDIFSGRITDHGCVHLGKITSLETLELCGGGVGDIGCAHLGNLDNLSSLNLSQNERITNRGAACLATLSNLRALNLSNTRVNSEALKFFGNLVKLQSLALYGCRGICDGESLKNLQRELPSLKCLRLNSLGPDDTSIDENTSYQSEEDGDDDILFDEHGGIIAMAQMHREEDDDASFSSSQASSTDHGESDTNNFESAHEFVEMAGIQMNNDDMIIEEDNE